MLDFNDAEPQMGPIGELIPDGTFAKLKLVIRPGGIDGPAPQDKGLLKGATKSDAKMLDCELIVAEGPYARRKLWQSFCVAGGKTDKDGTSIGWKISKSTFRAMIESATGIDPKDMGDAAKQKRTITSLSQLNGITFAARIMVEPASSPQYNDQNKIANVVLRGDEQYEPVMRGEQVTPDPINARPRKSAATAQATLAWGNEGTGGSPQQSSWGQSATAAQANANPAWLA
jgi:hypothetical protein